MPHTLTAEEEFCLEGCRGYAQYYHMRQNFEAKHCTFCNIDRTVNDVIWEDECVRAWEIPKKFQRSELAVQCMVVPVRHIRFPWELRKTELLSLSGAQIFLSREFDLPGGMWFARFGDMSLNSGTVPHLHYNLWVPNGTGKVSIPVLKGHEARIENQVRAATFAAQYEDGKVPT